MLVEDFWIYEDDFLGSAKPTLNLNLLANLRRTERPLPETLSACLALARLTYGEFLEFGTSHHEKLTNAGSQEALRTLTFLAKQVGFLTFRPPFNDFDSFRSHWLENGGHGNWQVRRQMLGAIFSPLISYLLEQEDTQAKANDLLESVTEDFVEGWSRVDEEISEMRRHYAAASTVQDFRNIGNDCVAIFATIASVVYNSDVHSNFEDPWPPEVNTILKISRFIQTRLPGSRHETLRTLVKKVNDLAHSAKHDLDGTALKASIAADSVLFLSSTLRKIYLETAGTGRGN